MRKLMALACAAVVALSMSGCTAPDPVGNYPIMSHYYNPFRLLAHFNEMLNPYGGEFQQFFVSLDRVIFGVDRYEQLETSEYVYTSR